jgi:type IV pilus assembly protein PilO
MKMDMSAVAALEQRVSGMTVVQKTLLFLLTFMVLCGGFYYLSYKPQSQKLQRLRQDIAEQEKRLAELKQAAAQASFLETEVAKLEAEFNRVLILLPDEKEIPGLLDNISRLAAQSGLENIFFQPQAEQVNDFYAVIPIRLELAGTYHKLGVFLDQLSKLNRIVNADNLNMTRQKGSSNLQVNCTISTYRFLDRPEQAKDTSKKK